jgi:hypothetical protein
VAQAAVQMHGGTGMPDELTFVQTHDSHRGAVRLDIRRFQQLREAVIA